MRTRAADNSLMSARNDAKIANRSFSINKAFIIVIIINALLNKTDHVSAVY